MFGEPDRAGLLFRFMPGWGHYEYGSLAIGGHAWGTWDEAIGDFFGCQQVEMVMRFLFNCAVDYLNQESLSLSTVLTSPVFPERTQRIGVSSVYRVTPAPI